MTTRRASPAQPPADRGALEPELVRLIEALARAHVDEDYPEPQQTREPVQ